MTTKSLLTYFAFASSILALPFTSHAVQGNTQGVARALEAIDLGAVPATGNLLIILNQIALISNNEDLNNSLATLAPIVDGAILYESFNIQNMVFGTIGDRMDRMNFWRQHVPSPSGVASGDEDASHGIWVKAFRQHGNQHARQNIAGYKDNTWGVIVGADTTLTNNSILGASLSWAALEVNNEVSVSNTHANEYQATMYANIDLDCPLFINGQIGVAYNNYIISRNVIFDDVVLFPRGHFHGIQSGAKAELGYVFGKYSFHAIPMATAYYANLDLRSYQETGAGTANQLVNGANFNTFLTGVGGKLVDDYALNDYMLFQSEIHAMLFYDWFNDNMQTTSQFVGAGPSFSTIGFSLARDSVNVGASLRLFSHYNVTLSGNYDFNYRQNYYSHAGSFTARYEF